jgi:hypothetical protein
MTQSHAQAQAINSLNFDLLNPEKNNGCYQSVSLAKGFDFVFVRPGSPNPAASTVRLFGDTAIEGFTIEELSASGSVPALQAKNATTFDVLLIAGQLVQGGKQNRGINADMLVGAGQSAKIPVTCVEQGRWSGTPRSRFGHAGFEPIDVRFDKMRDVHESHRAGGDAEANQSKVWSTISQMSRVLRSESPSADLLHSLRATKERLCRPMGASATEGQSAGPSTGHRAATVDPGVVEQLRLIEERLRMMQREARTVMAQLSAQLAEADSAEISTLRRQLDHALRGLSLLQQQYDRLRLQVDETVAGTGGVGGAGGTGGMGGAPVERVDIAVADAAAQGAAGMLVFFNGEFLAGDIFADPQWFAKVYGDLRDSALMSWDFVARRRALSNLEMDHESSAKAASTARSVVRDALGGDWNERAPIAHGRSMLLEHPYLESAVLGGRDGSPLHLLVGTKQQPAILRTNNERPDRMAY